MTIDIREVNIKAGKVLEPGSNILHPNFTIILNAASFTSGG